MIHRVERHNNIRRIWVNNLFSPPLNWPLRMKISLEVIAIPFLNLAYGHPEILGTWPRLSKSQWMLLSEYPLSPLKKKKKD